LHVLASQVWRRAGSTDRTSVVFGSQPRHFRIDGALHRTGQVSRKVANLVFHLDL
jgi:hypothetical protein